MTSPLIKMHTAALSTPMRTLVLDSPHSGTEYPSDFNYAVALQDLRQAEDTHVDTLFNFAPDIGIPLLEACFPRSYIDLNRSSDDIDEALLNAPWPEPILASEKSRLGKGLIWRILDDGQPIYDRMLSIDEIQHRIQTYWRPYHQTLKQLLQDTYQHHQCVMHINCHSMPSVADVYSTEHPGLEHPDIVLGDRDGRTADPSITEFLRNVFSELGYTCWVNHPYKGVELVKAYSDPAQNKHSIQLEINRRLYLNEATRELLPEYRRLRTHLQQILLALDQYIHDHFVP
ncbi:N-formylglutamate amidohydrolase [Nitrincola alkalisediminis]|uniref:N-formylglutamate amidohydrolase n=1 Tax=Nitrincola alkalisediminis TaxID=1366656 RepID=UPI001CA8945D|nr:N-formylglutamate amidohydrolase [Nitrincola alkalisediminis]